MNTDNVKSEWDLINRKTGEIRPMDVVENPKSMRWQKVYARTLADMLDLTGDEKTSVIAYLIKNKDYQNRVIATMKTISEATGVSVKTVNRTIQVLKKSNYLHKVQNGVWRFSPHIMCTGVGSLGMAVVTMYDDETQKAVEQQVGNDNR